MTEVHLLKIMVRSFRSANGMTMDEFAKKANVNESAITRIENNKAIMPEIEKKIRARRLIKEYEIPIKRACMVIGITRSMWYYQSKKDDNEVIDKLNGLAKLYPTITSK